MRSTTSITAAGAKRDTPELEQNLKTVTPGRTSLRGFIKISMMRRLSATLVLLLGVVFSTPAQASQRPTKIGVLDFGSTNLGKRVTQLLRGKFSSNSNIQLIDADLSTSAARGVGYSGSLNMSIAEARDLG